MLNEHKTWQTAIEEVDIFWVLTVPAMWGDPGKQFMIQAAERVISMKWNLFLFQFLIFLNCHLNGFLSPKNIYEQEIHIYLKHSLGSIFLYFSGWNGQQTFSNHIGFKSGIHLLQRFACEKIWWRVWQCWHVFSWTEMSSLERRG